MSERGDLAAPGLRRSLPPVGVLALTLAALSPAASVFVTGSAILHLVGSGALLALIGGGIAVVIASMLFAELGAAFPHAGGVYYGIGAVLGPRAGTAVLALGLVTAPALIAFVGLGLASYVRAIGVTLPPLAIADAAILLAVGVAALQLRAGLWLTGALLAAELLALAALAVLGWSHPARGLGDMLSHPVAAAPAGVLAAPGIVAMVLGTIAAAYACSGSSLALNFAEDLRGDPRAVGPIVLYGALVTVVLVALPLVGVVIAAPNLATAFSDEAPIAAVVHALAGAPAAAALAAVVALAIFDHIAGAAIAYSRFVYAAARSLGGRTTPLARLGGHSGAPATAALALGGVALLLTLLGERRLLLLISGELITPALMIVAVLVGRRKRLTGQQGYRSPFFPLLPIAGLAILATFAAADLLDPTARLSLLLMIGLALLAGAGGRQITTALRAITNAVR